MSLNRVESLSPEEAGEDREGRALSGPEFLMVMPLMSGLNVAKTSSGVPVTPSSQSSRTTTHSSSYDSGSLGSSTISGAYRPRSTWTPT